MKDGLKEIVGKQIAAVVVAKSDCHPRNQVFLVFADGSNFELYGENFTCCGGLDRTRDIERYVESGKRRIVRVYGDAARLEPERASLSTGPEIGPPYHVAAPETLEGLLTRDLNAWMMAKAAVEKARRRST